MFTILVIWQHYSKTDLQPQNKRLSSGALCCVTTRKWRAHVQNYARHDTLKFTLFFVKTETLPCSFFCLIYNQYLILEPFDAIIWSIQLGMLFIVLSISSGTSESKHRSIRFSKSLKDSRTICCQIASSDMKNVFNGVNTWGSRWNPVHLSIDFL